MRSLVRRHAIYGSEFCVGCPACFDRHDKRYIPPRLVPINPEVYVTYLCELCFVHLSVTEVIKTIRRYLASENGLFRMQMDEWRKGTMRDPFCDLESSVKYLRGALDTPPFACATFTLHDRYIKGYPRITTLAHLALISLK